MKMEAHTPAGAEAASGAAHSSLRAQRLRKRYKSRTVVQDVSLEVTSGEVVGLLGPNGAGKTTCFYMIVGLVPVDAGAIYLDQTELTHQPIHRRARLGIARTWQHVRLFPTLSVLDNVLLGPRDYPGDAKKAEAALARVGLAGHAGKLPGELPFGQQKLAGLARTLMNDGDVLLLDEPMAGVEGQVYETIKQVVREEIGRAHV